MSVKINLDNIAVVLHQPRYPENIGAAARAMCNMGVGRLIVVDPINYDLEKVLKLATHAALDVIENIKFFESLGEALASYHYVVGTTARLGGQRQAVISPARLAQKLVALSDQNRIAIVFGTENRGLSNEDIRYCDALVNIPATDFSSINLAQAVMILCYEIFNIELKEDQEATPRLASSHELEGMYAQLKEILVRINYLNPENPDYWLNKLRRFFSRLHLRAREVNMIRGLCRQVNWYGDKCYQEGLSRQSNSSSGEDE